MYIISQITVFPLEDVRDSWKLVDSGRDPFLILRLLNDIEIQLET